MILHYLNIVFAVLLCCFTAARIAIYVVEHMPQEKPDDS